MYVKIFSINITLFRILNYYIRNMEQEQNESPLIQQEVSQRQRPPSKINGTFSYWLITVNNPPSDWKGFVEKTLVPTWFIGQLEEAPVTKTPHIQGLVYYSSKRRVSAFKNVAHAIGISALDARTRVTRYVTKSETRLDGPIELGTSPFRGSVDYGLVVEQAKKGHYDRIDAKVLVTHMSNLIKITTALSASTGRDCVRGIWVWGEPGTGKSHYARQEYGKSLYLKA